MGYGGRGQAQIAQEASNLTHAHTTRVHRGDLVIDAGDAPLMLPQLKSGTPPYPISVNVRFSRSDQTFGFSARATERQHPVPVRSGMRLYYMTSLDTLEKYILPELRLRLSTFDAVNDPFELLGTMQTDREGRQHFAGLYKHWVNTLGFVSFSDNWRSPLMWGHYAKNHTGVCLGIELPDKRPMKVSYEPRRLEVLLEMSPLEAAVDEDVIKKVVTTKFKEWEYEREWRYLEKLDNKDEETGFHYVDFSPDFELREVIAGARCARSLEDIRKQVFGNTETITMFKARAAFGTFSMVEQKTQNVLTISPFHQAAGFGRDKRRNRKKEG